MLVATDGDPSVFRSAIAQTVRRLDSSIPLNDTKTLREYFSIAAYPFRLLAFVMAGCGAMALLLAVVGIYGTISYSVAQRRKEVGIRIALGAVRSDILKLVVGQGMTLVSYGLAIGLVLGTALTWVLTSLPLDTSLLFGESATDVATFAGVTMLLGAVAMLACYVPARRAAGEDPMEVLRSA